jgi:prepilin-type processing-associated H-X9-DG protein
VDVFSSPGSFEGRTASDGIFNHNLRSGGRWQVDIQDSVNADWFGRDAAGDDRDLVLGYDVIKGDTSAQVRVDKMESGWQFQVLNHKGQTIWAPASSGNGPVGLPIIWMSYGANAMAGLKSVKGNPVLLLELAKPGVFPLELGPPRPADVLAASGSAGTSLRFRHGGHTPDHRLRGAYYTRGGGYTGLAPDPHYTAGTRMNVGFYDGHVERVHYEQVIRSSENTFWLGASRATDRVYD